jgi:tRNA-dihydrouridine synthase B
MRSAAAIVAEAGADLIDINMGCPVRKVCKTGAGAAMLSDHELAVRIATAAREGGGIPVTVKLRSGIKPGGREGFELALRLAADAGVSAIGFHPRSVATQHKGQPDYALAHELVERLEVPMIISGGLDTPEDALHAYKASGADAVMIARGSLGNPWIFEQLTGRRTVDPERAEIIAELLWVIDKAEVHLGPDRAARYLRKFYPWYLERLEADRETAADFQQSEDLDQARRLVRELEAPAETMAA